MQSNPGNDNNQRPTEFDVKLASCMPSVRKQARKLTKDYEDLVQDSIITILCKWTQFRNDGKYTGLATWCTFMVRHTHCENMKKSNTKKRSAKTVDISDVANILSTAPRQEDIMYASEMVRGLSYTRGGRMLVRFAAGESVKDIGRRRKISGEHARKLIEEARAKLVRTEVAA